MPNTVFADLRNNLPHKDDRRILNFQFKGYIVTVGKNSFSNERIISDHPHKECLWFHAMAARGSHVILCHEGRPEPPNDVILYAAGLALEHSHSQARTVTVALLRDVFKPEDGAIGVWKASHFTSVEAEE